LAQFEAAKLDQKLLYQSISVWIAEVGWTPQLFSQPQLYTICIRFTSQFWSGSDRRKVQPPS